MADIHRPQHRSTRRNIGPGLLIAAALALGCLQARAQPSVSVPAPVASASTKPQPGPKLLSPTALRDSATAPGSLRPERPALPQVSVPMGVPPPEPAPSSPGALPPNLAASAGGTSDAVARCEAKLSALERRQCRRQLAQQSPPAR